MDKNVYISGDNEAKSNKTSPWIYLVAGLMVLIAVVVSYDLATRPQSVPATQTTIK